LAGWGQSSSPPQTVEDCPRRVGGGMEGESGDSASRPPPHPGSVPVFAQSAFARGWRLCRVRFAGAMHWAHNSGRDPPSPRRVGAKEEHPYRRAGTGVGPAPQGSERVGGTVDSRPRLGRGRGPRRVGAPTRLAAWRGGRGRPLRCVRGVVWTRRGGDSTPPATPSGVGGAALFQEHAPACPPEVASGDRRRASPA
jgi:hypothetical protein